MRSRPVVLMCAGVMALSLVAAGCSSTGATASVPTRSVEELTKDMGNAVNSQVSTKSVRITDSGAQKDPTSADATQNFVVEGTMDGSNMLFEQNFSTGYSVSMVLVDDKVYTKRTTSTGSSTATWTAPRWRSMPTSGSATTPTPLPTM
ncbi:Hypothetical protein PFR_JS9-2_1998 [Propionibacterium freudenreichii]|nr:Hypothetical protein PFR_JS9-1_2000 [Propionibacterium freudenreichii]SCQ70532.1 Hypothetical protein PFR_JS9-2_1998 [Propionibacterium freudenreichii]